MTLHGKMQHWQSSPHQQGFVTGGLNNPVAVNPAVPPRFVTDALDAEAADEVAAELVDVVEGGMIREIQALKIKRLAEKIGGSVVHCSAGHGDLEMIGVQRRTGCWCEPTHCLEMG